MLRLFRPQVISLIRLRDRAVDDWRAGHPGIDVFEDRELEISSMAPISVWFLMIIITVAFFMGMLFISWDADYLVDSMMELIQGLKIDWAFAGAVAFYFLTHVTRGGK